MSKIHVLESGADGYTRFVVHVTTPDGVNSAKMAWKDVFMNAGISGKTVLTVGTGPGQIDAIENASVEAGDLIEFEFGFPATSDDIPKAQVIFDKMTTDRLSEIMTQHGYYGLTLDW